MSAKRTTKRLNHITIFSALLVLAGGPGGCTNEEQPNATVPPHTQAEAASSPPPAEKTPEPENLMSTLSSSALELAARLDQQQKELRGVANEEVSKLFTVEYKVVDISVGAGTIEAADTKEEPNGKRPNPPTRPDSATIEKELAELGKNRWLCFHVSDTEQGVRVYCQRPSPTYLRIVAQGIPKAW